MGLRILSSWTSWHSWRNRNEPKPNEFGARFLLTHSRVKTLNLIFIIAPSSRRLLPTKASPPSRIYAC
jgi:hypothetical protein